MARSWRRNRFPKHSTWAIYGAMCWRWLSSPRFWRRSCRAAERELRPPWPEPLDHRAFVLVARPLAGGLDELFALRAEPHDERARHEHRGIDAEQNSDGEGEREVMQCLAAEDEHGSDHHLRAAVG